mmetsp:Transcript_30307/g.78442  ORF Transcript_30307/g.78442 Transcript_30307/m.78442 type:complete len:598 (-) Transcript_30307:334-2127(-)
MAEEENSAMVWNMMAAVGESDSRRSILVQLGFDINDMPKPASAEAVPTLDRAPTKKKLIEDVAPAEEEGDGSDFFSGSGIGSLDLGGGASEASAGFGSEKEEKVEEIAASSEASAAIQSGNAEEDAEIQKWLVVGNIEKAVEVCVKLNRQADALVLASIQSPELWEKVKKDYLESRMRMQTGKSHLASIMAGVSSSSLDDYIDTADIGSWKDALGVLCTYADRDTFPDLCVRLGNRLDGAAQYAAACLCYICARDVESAMNVWTKSCAAEGRGRSGVWVLLSVVEMVTSFLKLTGAEQVPSNVAKKVLEFAEIIASQGEMAAAQWLAKTVENTSGDAAVLASTLKERLAHALQPSTSVSAVDAAGQFAGEEAVYASNPAPAAVETQSAAAGYGGYTQESAASASASYGEYTQPQAGAGGSYDAQGGYTGYDAAPAANTAASSYAPAPAATQSYSGEQAAASSYTGQGDYSGGYEAQQTAASSYSAQTGYSQGANSAATSSYDAQGSYSAYSAQPEAAAAAAAAPHYSNDSAEHGSLGDFDTFDGSQTGDMASVVHSLQNLALRLGSVPTLPPAQKKEAGRLEKEGNGPLLQAGAPRD